MRSASTGAGQDRLCWHQINTLSAMQIAPVRRCPTSHSSTRLKRWVASKANLNHSLEGACNAFISKTNQNTFQPNHHSGKISNSNQLDGLKVAIKDIFCMQQNPTTCASKTLKDFTSPYDSYVVSKLRQHGAKIIGKTNMDEFSMGSSSTNSYFGPVLNPKGYDFKKNLMVQSFSAGGSSGGSAVAVATGECDVAIGSDTGGSTRLPAAYCGVIGLKPSYGLISRFGMVQYSNSLDTVGILSTTTDLIRKTFVSLDAFDHQDPTSIPLKTRLKSQKLNELWFKKRWERRLDDLSGLRVGVPIEYFTSDLSDQVINGFKTAVDFLKKRGVKFVSISLPTTESCLGAYYVIASAEASSNLARYSGLHYGYRSSIDSPCTPVKAPTDSTPERLYASTRSDAFGIEVKRRLLLGSYALSASGMKNYFIQAQKVRLQVRSEFDKCFQIPNALNNDFTEDEEGGSEKLLAEEGEEEEGVDVIMTPATKDAAPSFTGLDEVKDEWSQDQLLVPASLAGLPAIVFPIVPEHPPSHQKLDSHWPVGVQFISQWGTEPILFLVGSVLERIKNKC